MKLIFRCDATPATGLGHLSRSLALAEALRRLGGQAVFSGHWGDAAFTLLSASGFMFREALASTGGVEDAEELARLVAAVGADGALADSYDLNSAWVAHLAARGVAITLFDDFARLTDYSACAGVLNFTIGASQLDYPGLSMTRRALGPDCFPARENLRWVRDHGRGITPVPLRRVLITLGGGDRLGLTIPIYRALRHLHPGLQVRAILADGPAQAAALKLNAADFPPPAGDLAAHYAWADVCVTGGGLVKYECAYLGLPMAIFSQTPEQQAETNLFCAAGLGWDLAPQGRNETWEFRLEAFLRNPVPVSGPRLCFPADSADRAVAALQRFITTAVVALAPVPIPVSA